MTDHHALLITENAAIGLFKDEKIVYDMILCQMIDGMLELVFLWYMITEIILRIHIVVSV